MMSDKKRVRIIYLLSAILPMAIMSLVWFLMGTFPFGNKTHMAIDFGQQYIGLYSFLRESVLSADFSSLFYSFSKSLGGAMIGVWGFNLISPFNIFYIIFPQDMYPWAIFLSILLRYGAMGLAAAFFFVRRYEGAGQSVFYVPLFTTAYALSGMIVSYQMNPIFYDAMIILPIILVYLEEYLDGGTAFKYILSLAFAFILHFYMAYMISIFIALYTLFYYLWPKKKQDFSFKEYFVKTLGVLLSSVWSVLMTIFLLLPIVLNLILSKGAYENELKFEFALQINPLDIISKLMIGAFDNESGWLSGPNLPNIFVGSIALIGLIYYFFDKSYSWLRKTGVGIILFVFFAGFVHMFTNKLWHMGQTPAGFFYRYSWIVSFFIVFLAYKTFRNKVKLPLVANLAVPIILILAASYVFKKEYTYISAKQNEELTSLLNGNVYIVYAVAGLLAILIAYIIYLSTNHKYKYYQMILSVLTVGAATYFLLKGYLVTQVGLTLATWLAAFVIFKFVKNSKVVAIALALLSFELTMNAYLSQHTIGYDNAPKFSDATSSVGTVVDKIKEDDPSEFYRVGSTFIYSKNDPFMHDFKGLSTFSSNLEKSTLDFFGYMGDFGGNAATYYANGNQWTDAMYSVKYFIDRKDYTNADMDSNPDKKYFQLNSSRFDLASNYQKIYEDDRYLVYKNDKVLPLAFGVSDKIMDVDLKTHYPIDNHNNVLSAIGGEDKYFVSVGVPKVALDNAEQVLNNGKLYYENYDYSKPATVTLKLYPETDEPHYFLAPTTLRDSMGGKIDIKLDNKWYYYTQSFDQYQLWNVANGKKGQEILLSFENKTDKVLDLSGMGFFRADSQKIAKLIEDRAKQGMEISEWTNTKIKGRVNITDSSNLMMTTVPYNPGWTVKVDGKEVDTVSILDNSLLAFPITKGQHEIEMTFTPQGWYIGLGISAVAILGFILLVRQDRKGRAENK